MNPHIGAAMWIIAMLVGFVIWWPIGAMILAAITLRRSASRSPAISSTRRRNAFQPLQPYQPLPPLYFDAEGKHIKQVTQSR